MVPGPKGGRINTVGDCNLTPAVLGWGGNLWSNLPSKGLLLGVTSCDEGWG